MPESMLECNTSSTVNSGYRSTWKINLLRYSPRKCLFFLSLSWWSHLLSEHLATKWDLLLVPYSYWEMLLLGYFRCQSAPQSDQFAGANFWAHDGSPAIKSVWQLGIGFCFLSLRYKEINVCLIWKVESWSGARITVILRLSRFPLCSQEFCSSSTSTLKALTSLIIAGAAVILSVKSFWRFLVPGLVWCKGDHRIIES